MPTRKDAWNLLCEYTESDSLRRHGLAVEQVMRKMAQKYGEDEELWAMTGLLHDFDYEKYPTMEEHPFVGNKILKENGYPEELTTAIMGHANYTVFPERVSWRKHFTLSMRLAVLCLPSLTSDRQNQFTT